MLKHGCRIGTGMKGVDPDGTDMERAAGETAWFKNHPAITAGEREKKRAIAAKNRAVLLGVGTGKKAPY
jgi:hypothetical protein